MVYKQLSLTERHYIEIQYKLGASMNKISQDLNRSQSTISREIARNTGKRGYRHKQANELAVNRHKEKDKAYKLTPTIKVLIEGYLQQDWSPEQIAGRLKISGVATLHHETVYRYVHSDKKAGGSLYKHLRHQNKRYRKRYGSVRNGSGIPNRVDIDHRPEVVNTRQRVGDWEADTIIGKNHQGAIVTLDERKSKLRLAYPLRGKRSGTVTEAINMLLRPVKSFVNTITFDNGKEFAMHENIAKETACDTYFAKPYDSWERGQNENGNGLLRQYFPKTMPLNDVCVSAVNKAVDKLNSRPRKCLGYKTPYEVFEELTGINVKNLPSYALIS